jgi:flavin reductase (DIM6/NTAB) family NADH-FMN oxidoreductase RutF
MRKNFGPQNWMYPLPVLIVGSYDENGKPNAMNAAWGGIYEEEKVILCLSEGHKTTQNILKTKAFTVSFADASHVVEADYLGIVSGNDQGDKLGQAGLHTEKSGYVNAPIIREFPLTLECVLDKRTEDGNLIGRIVNVSADESILDADGGIDVAKLNAIIYDPCGHGYWSFGKKVGQAFSDGAALK